ncbi:50S ribosomal protein L6 [Treponema pectinovorum]|uniref:50S ribosomal protein L6 n=1 Tax=Treponema pectinovorum TaxID=164 RepID=UPI0011CA333E|nr:50S ribosomal protein L6 [Treponema pectinovorum]
MSKIGKLPVTIPAGVTVTVNAGEIVVKGPKGELKQHVNDCVKFEVKDGTLTVTPVDESKAARASHGLYRALVFNMVTGVTQGFSKTLVVNGVGFRSEVQGKHLVMNLGFSSDFIAIIPDGLTVTTDASGKVTISGADKKLVGEFSAQIRKLRLPEPYKGKGIRYSDEIIRRKVGKTGVK